MSRKFRVIILATVTLGTLLAVTALVLPGCSATKAITEPEAPTYMPIPPSTPATVYQSPDCNCCTQHVAYLKSEGFQVEVVYVEDEGASIREKYSIPPNLWSCHTALIEDYFVEGHMPIEAIIKLLAEKPAIDGIVLPGMPSGSPGMPGPKTEEFIIYAISDDEVSEFLILH